MIKLNLKISTLAIISTIIGTTTTMINAQEALAANYKYSPEFCNILNYHGLVSQKYSSQASTCGKSRDYSASDYSTSYINNYNYKQPDSSVSSYNTYNKNYQPPISAYTYYQKPQQKNTYNYQYSYYSYQYKPSSSGQYYNKDYSYLALSSDKYYNNYQQQYYQYDYSLPANYNYNYNKGAYSYNYKSQSNDDGDMSNNYYYYNPTYSYTNNYNYKQNYNYQKTYNAAAPAYSANNYYYQYASYDSSNNHNGFYITIAKLASALVVFYLLISKQGHKTQTKQ